MSNEKFRKKLGHILKTHRKKFRMSQEQVARALEISYQQIQKYEYGNSKLSCERLLQFAKIFKTTPEAIILKARTES